MNITINKNKLNDVINQVSKALTSRTTIPILTGIKLEAYQSGLTFTTSDTEISIQSFISPGEEENPFYTIEKEGSIVIPSKLFVELVKKLPADKVHIEVNESLQITISSGKTMFQLVGMDPEEYPVLPILTENKKITISSFLLKSMLRQTVFAISSNESTPILTGVHWSYEQNTLKLVATDRHRLASVEAQIEDQADVQFSNVVIPGKTLNELLKLIPDQSTMIDIVVTNNQVLFKFSSTLFFTRIIDGTYPDTSRIIPTTFKTELEFETEKLTASIERAYLVSREGNSNIVHMTSTDDQAIEISSSSKDFGQVTEEVSTNKQTGEPLKIAFNSKFLLDILKVMDSQSIEVNFTGSMSPIVLRPEDDQKILHLILPYRTTN